MSDETKPEPKPGDLLAEQAAAMAATAAMPGAAALAGGIAAAGAVAESATPKTGIDQYLIAGGGGRPDDHAMQNAVVSALNRLAGFKSRM
jgi:hypothetical protein